MVRGDRRGGPTAIPRPQALQNRTGPIGDSISRPTQIPQWPLRGGPIVPISGPSDPESNQQTTARSQPPQRPPRPSRVPSILDSSRVQDPTPVFQYQAKSVAEPDTEFNSSIPPTPSSTQTLSSTASIPDFPMPGAPGASAMPPPRRSVTLGPPPSSRRGASSFYSNVSFVSPIPEESPRIRSYTSLASSAAMPESWGSSLREDSSPGLPDDTDGDVVGVTSDGDGSKIVRSASLGKMAKPQIVMNKGGLGSGISQRPDRTAAQENPFADATGLAEASSSESLRGAPESSTPAGFAAAGYGDPAQPPRRAAASPQPDISYNRLSAIRQPPRLDMEAVEKANARGSMTSLPELIRRATRLAGMIDRGKRPASRFEDLDYPDEKARGGYSDQFSSGDDRYQSGLSDMLAAFPPPAQARASRPGSWFRGSAGSWPLSPPNAQGNAQQDPGVQTRDAPETAKGKRKYCGLPLWALIIVVILIVGIIAAAIFVPLQFFVFNNRNGGGPFGGTALEQCRSQLSCRNGGTNVVTRDVCSCICTNGFTGVNCDSAGSAGCTTTRLVNMDDNPNIDNVTLGQAIPRLITGAQGNFSVPLSGTTILARFNTGSLSCTAQNSLVTFDGRSVRPGAAAQALIQEEDASIDSVAQGAIFVSISVITVFPEPTSVSGVPNGGFRTIPSPNKNFISPGTTTTTVTETLSSPPTRATATNTPTTGTPNAFTIDEVVLDFARVAVLFILQENGIADASRAQAVLQRFFTSADTNSRSAEQAMNIDLENGNTIDLVNLRIDAGTGVFGGTAAAKRSLDSSPLIRPRGCRQFARHK
ncbi:uncharacterized protein DNG_03027 [Cephalotrichum gorgonifer]|uniref:EGF-like domain-containing protein n=1 Tax=Cephalotrichum gorgonifer TaxID=2041049 RepID=A0AAE8MW60_9PEZI|nr:uncharacterized protein DNG_03027 [Cephalotrichum gorgonifer]